MSSMNAPSGEIEHINYLSEHIGALFLSEEYSDVTLIVEGNRFPAHKVILASRSDYFRALLYGGMKESQQSEIEMKSATVEAFKGLLRYIYTGHISLGNLKEEVILDTLGLSHQYGFTELESAIGDYLREILQIKNVCVIYDSGRLYQLQFLTKFCTSFMDRNALDIIHHESFNHLSPDALREILQRDSFYAPEVEIFRAVWNWSKANPDADVSSILEVVRLPLMSIEELLDVVRPANLVSPETILDAIQARTQAKDSDLQYRGCLLPEENVAHLARGTQVLKGEMRSALLDGNTDNYDLERGYTRHSINESEEHGIVIKLGTQAIINHMRMLLWDKDLRSYSYYVEVSMNQKDWVRVIDHTRYYCRSWQYLYFKERVVSYIRIVGTNNTVNKVFHVVSFEAMYTNKMPTLQNGLIVPKENVATIKRSASVIEGVSRSRDALLNGETNKYDWDSGYTCHQLNSGFILVQLGQPYMIDSMRLLLWDCDERSYSYYIETSVNAWEWEIVADKTRENCRSWQTLTFERRPVVFIKITGTHNTANEVFHCVHFECPAQTEVSDSQCPSISRLTIGGSGPGGGSKSLEVWLAKAAEEVVLAEDGTSYMREVEYLETAVSFARKGAMFLSLPHNPFATAAAEGIRSDPFSLATEASGGGVGPAAGGTAGSDGVGEGKRSELGTLRQKRRSRFETESVWAEENRHPSFRRAEI